MGIKCPIMSWYTVKQTKQKKWNRLLRFTWASEHRHLTLEDWNRAHFQLFRDSSFVAFILYESLDQDFRHVQDDSGFCNGVACVLLEFARNWFQLLYSFPRSRSFKSQWVCMEYVENLNKLPAATVPHA